MPSLKQLETELARLQAVLVDSSVILAWHSPTERAHAAAEVVFAEIESDSPLRGYYSVISAAEVLVRPIRAGRDRYQFMHAFLTDFRNLAGVPVDFQVAQQAASIRVATNLKLPDALIVASGLLAGCEAIVTSDDRWKRRLEPLFTQFRWISLGDYA